MPRCLPILFSTAMFRIADKYAGKSGEFIVEWIDEMSVQVSQCSTVMMFKCIDR